MRFVLDLVSAGVLCLAWHAFYFWLADEPVKIGALYITGMAYPPLIAILRIYDRTKRKTADERHCAD